MFKRALYFFAKQDEKEVSEALLQAFPGLKFVDDQHWPTADPPLVAGIHKCKSGLAYLWPSDLEAVSVWVGFLQFENRSVAQEEPSRLSRGQVDSRQRDNSSALGASDGAGRISRTDWKSRRNKGVRRRLTKRADPSIMAIWKPPLNTPPTRMIVQTRFRAAGMADERRLPAANPPPGHPRPGTGR